jgi:RimJ/RimL family protein N-acetyltransferase
MTSASRGEGLGHQIFVRIGVSVLLGKLLHRMWSTRASLSLVREPLVEVPVAAGFTLGIVQPEAFEGLAQLLESSTGTDYLFVRNAERTRLAGVGTMSVARDETGQLMAFHFVYEPEDRVALDGIAPNMFPDLAADEVLTELVYCVPAFRGRDLMRQLLHATGSTLAARGKRRAFAWVDTTNTRSLRTFARAGYVPAGVERVDRYRFGQYRATFRHTTVASEERWDAVVRGV